MPKSTSSWGQRGCWLLAATILGLVAERSAQAGSPPLSPEDRTFFTQKVQPVLQASCFKCHSHEAKRSRGGLVVDSLAALLKGGETGPAIVPGKPEESLLLRALSHEDDSLSMPPDGKLGQEAIETLTEWVRRGAPWPGADTAQAATVARERIREEDRQYWFFQPLAEVSPPQVDDPAWARNPIDRFILARLRAEKLMPAPPAQRASLIRRVYYDLAGLPPSPEEVDAFVRDADPRAYEKLVDRLLASPRYGERWGRHWLDLVRYAESDGYRADGYRPEAWRYRDYVIRSFNEDKPYDRFVLEQIAGDEIAPDDPDALIATSYLRLGIYEYNQRDVRTQWSDMLNDITDVTADVFLGLGMGCARCHDHKFDPLLQKDYYRLQAFFTPILPRDDVPLATPDQLAEYQARRARWEEKTAEIRRRIDAVIEPLKDRAARSAIEKFPEDIRAMLLKPEEERAPLEKQLAALAYRQVTYEHERIDRLLKGKQKEEVEQLRQELARHEAEKPADLPLGMTVADVGPVAPPTLIPQRGGGEPVEPGYLAVLGGEVPTITPSGHLPSTGRRAALARWLSRPDNQLTTRVVVNRIWQYHFGRGLVATSSDFGKLGEKPSHPELLDWLARRFVEDGWSFKKMHRLILLSQAYQQGAFHPDLATGMHQDPENRLLWHMPTRRLDAEQIRDTLLAVTGKLDLTAGGPSVPPSQPRRTVYTQIHRNKRDPLLDVFDVPEAITSTAQRNITTTPTQALLMFNSEGLVQHARALAQRIGREASGDPERVERLFQLTLGRAPSQKERDLALAYLRGEAPEPPVKPESKAVAQAASMPNRDGQGVLFTDRTPPQLHLPDSPRLPRGSFTIEAHIHLHSIYPDGRVRPIATHWDGKGSGSGWAFGVTGKGSRFKPQVLVLQLWGKSQQGKPHHEPIFSDLHIELNRPYYVAVSVRLEDTGKSGITFYAKDLSDNNVPLRHTQREHQVVELPASQRPFLLGLGEPAGARSWNGILDDVRLSRDALGAEHLLFTVDGVGKDTVGYWQLEASPGVLEDASGNGLKLHAEGLARQKRPPAEQQNLVDLCHVLLNCNEILYVD